MRRVRSSPWTDGTRSGAPLRLAFAECEIDLARRSLERAGLPVEVEPRVFDFLVFLIEHRDRVVSTDELLDAVWDGAAVTSSSLSQAVYKARLAVGDDGEEQRIIRTVHGRGFRFVAPVSSGVPEARGADGAPLAALDPQLAPLEEALCRVRLGRGAVVVLIGRAEGSENRLAQRFASRVRVHEDVSTYSVRCFEGLRLVPYWPWRLLAGALASDRLVGDFDALAGVTNAPARPIGSDRRGIPSPAAASGRIRLRLFESAMEALAGEARKKSLLVVLEDLHWADPASLAFLRFLARFLPAIPILVVATVDEASASGDEERSRLIAELGADAGVVTIALAPPLRRGRARPSLARPSPERASGASAR